MTDDLLPALPDETFERVLCIAAHPDDLEYGTAGPVAVWTARGVRVRYLMLTRGEAGIDSMEPDTAREVRTGDEIAAAEVVGAEGVDFLDLVDGEVEYGLPLRRSIAAAIRRFRPDTVVVGTWELESPWGLNHADHRVAGVATVDAIRDAGNRWIFRDLIDEGLEPWTVQRLLVGTPLGASHGVALDAAALEKAVASLEAHAGYLAALTDHPSAKDTVTGMAEMMGRSMGVPHAATFKLWQMSGPPAETETEPDNAHDTGRTDAMTEPATGASNAAPSEAALDAEFADAPLEVLEDDEDIPPRPEEELADIERSEPDR